MSVLDRVPSEKKDYNFLSGDLSFIDEMDQEKQPMEIDERPDFINDEQEFADMPHDPEDENPDKLNAAAEETAVFVTDVLDTGLGYGLALIAHGKAETYMATPDQKKRIEKIIRVYCDRMGGNMPLWLQFAIILIIVYGSKIPGAIDDRKINLLQAKIEEQEKRLKAYEAEKKANEMQQELERRKKEDAANGNKEGQ